MADAKPLTTRPAVAVKPGLEPLPTMDELKQMFADARYPDLSKQLPRVLVLRGKAAEPYNRYDLLMLRFETNMRLKAVSPALTSLADAEEATDDPKKINYAKAVTLLIKRSKGLSYQPGPTKKEKPPAIDLVDPASRELALKAFYADEVALITPKVEKALDGPSLAGIADAVRSLQGFDVLESAAGGGDEASRMVNDLRVRGYTLMAKRVALLTTRVDEIYTRATALKQYVVRNPLNNGFGVGGVRGVGNQNLGQNGLDEVRVRKQGLTNQDYAELNAAKKSAEQVVPNAKGLANATGGKVKEVEDLIVAAEELRRKADKTLNTNYNE